MSISRKMLDFDGKVRVGMVRQVEYCLTIWWRLRWRMDKRGVCAASRRAKCILNDLHSCIVHR